MKFIALGGTNYVGANCYYLSLGGQHFLLDCGRGTDRKHPYLPDFDALLEHELLSLSQLDAVLLSHGHFDHVGSLNVLREMGCKTHAYATGMTIALMDALLVDKMPQRFAQNGWERLSREMRSEDAIRSVTAVSYGKPFFIGPVKVTFYPAGHVPGAAMIYLESPEGNVLYTGDFQKGSFGLTGGMMLPENLRTDILILCGMHAKHPTYLPVESLPLQAQATRKLLSEGRNVHIQANQLTKSMETAQWLSRQMPDARIYLDRDTWTLGEKLEQAGETVMRRNFYRETDETGTDGGCITVGTRDARPGERPLRVNISLHGVYSDCEKLVEQVKPKTVFLVHSPDDLWGIDGNTALSRHFASCDMDIISPLCGYVYSND